MTGSAFNIIWGQIPALMGYNSLVNTREATYKVVINTLKHLPNTKLDAVFGLIPLVILYVWKWWCGTFGITLADRYYRNQPKVANRLKSFYFYAQAMRNAVVIVVFYCHIVEHNKKQIFKRPSNPYSGYSSLGLK
ncbi:ANL_collapsed_G0004770.mRNA.1.CDS.1 [Saccharomyces cerevisiae]|nr:ANL_collapsed_G0004770.mRNA.1.CDS.1 [Saccharomyces cerevisiae]